MASEEKFTRQTITGVQPINDKLFTFRATRNAGFRFRAGQFARLGLPGTAGVPIWRAYSMVSAPHDEFLEFFSVVVPGGEFTSQLQRLKAGDELLIDRQSYGFLTLDRFADGRDLWLLASGTGVAPFLSILQDLEVWQRFARVILVYSVRWQADLAYQQLLAQLPRRQWLEGVAEKLVYLPVVTREQAGGMLHGRITHLLASGELEQAAGVALTPEHSRLMLCGNPLMVTELRGALKARGLNLALTRRPGQVAVENYW